MARAAAAVTSETRRPGLGGQLCGLNPVQATLAWPSYQVCHGTALHSPTGNILAPDHSSTCIVLQHPWLAATHAGCQTRKRARNPPTAECAGQEALPGAVTPTGANRAPAYLPVLTKAQAAQQRQNARRGRRQARGALAADAAASGGGAAMCSGFTARAYASGRLANLRHLGTYARCVKLLYPLRSMESRICLRAGRACASAPG